MEKEENLKNKYEKSDKEEDSKSINNETKDKKETQEKEIEKTSEEKILELEDKLARTYAEMENQRRRFEKEKEEAYEYGGFYFAKEALSLIDNLERSKQTLENDEVLKNSEALKKTLEHMNIINKDLISI